MAGAVGTQSLEQSRGMKVRSSVKKLCDGCKVRDCLPLILMVWVVRMVLACGLLHGPSIGLECLSIPSILLAV